MPRNRVGSIALFLALFLATSLAIAACGAAGNVPLTGTWVGSGTERQNATPFAMLITMQVGNDGSLSARGQSCTLTYSSTWISYSGQGHNSDVQGANVDLTLLESENESQYYGFHGTLSGSTLTLDDAVGSRAPAHLILHPGTTSDYHKLCMAYATAAASTAQAEAAAATATTQAEAVAATATVQAAPRIGGNWAVVESHVVCTPGPGQPASVCAGNIANYPMTIQQTGIALKVTFPPTPASQLTLYGGLQGSQFTVSGHYQFRGSQSPYYGSCADQYNGTVVASNQLSGTYTTKCTYNYNGAVMLNQTGNWVATRHE